MRITEDKEKGLFAIALDDSEDNILRFGRMKYDGNERHYTPDCILEISDFISFFTKKEAKEAAKRLRFTQDKVEKIGSRFCSVWGIRHDFRDKYFLAKY